MDFSQKIRKLREQYGLTQAELAEKLGISIRTYNAYENTNQRPRYRKTYADIAGLFGVDINFLLTDEEDFILSTRRKYGENAARDARELVEGVLGIFAGGSMSLQDKKAILDAFQEAYYIAKKDSNIKTSVLPWEREEK